MEARMMWEIERTVAPPKAPQESTVVNLVNCRKDLKSNILFLCK